MTTSGEQAGWPEGNDTDFNLLDTQEALDEDEVGDYNDTGYSPADRPAFITGWGITAREATGHEDLTHRLAREVREDSRADSDGDDIDGITFDADGEPIDDQAGDLRAGRLIISDLEEFDSSSDYVAHDVGIDGGAATAEEAAIHIIPDRDGPFTPR